MNLHRKGLLGLAFVLMLALAACSGGASTESPTEVPNPEPEAMDPSVTVSDQDASAGMVLIDFVHAADPGWIVIHADNEGSPGAVLGYSQVDLGDNADVAVEIDLSQATSVLYAMLHLDAGTVGEYEFPGDDGPVRVADKVVNVPFQVELALASMESSVTVSDQDASKGTVSINLIYSTGPAWIVIHADNDGGPGAVLGYSQVSEGDNKNVAVEIDLSQATPVLYAMLHLDAGTVGEYEFPGDDVPVFVGDTMVNVPFNADLGPGLVTDMGEEYSVEIKDSRFDEGDLTVPVGATVVWRYDASLPHTVTADNGEFDSGTLRDEGETFSFTFTEEGVYAYHCSFHGSAGGSGMSGTITVGTAGAGSQGDDVDDLY